MRGTGQAVSRIPARGGFGLPCHALRHCVLGMEMKGSVALVTGGARRVGRAIALELARGGCDIVVHYGQSEADASAVREAIESMGRGFKVGLPGICRCHAPRTS